MPQKYPCQYRLVTNMERSSCIRCLFLTLLVQFCEGYKNVLFISVDDLRPELGAYVDKTTSPPLFSNLHTPNIDALAAKSLVLKRAFVQQPLCAPSRVSILTGRRPDTTRVHGFRQYFRELAGNFTTVPQYFKEHGYDTIGFGKIFHNGPDPRDDDPISWSEPFSRAKRKIEDMASSWKAVPDNNLSDKPLRDQQVADQAMKALQRLAPEAKSGKKPFFLAAGFYKPHLPFIFPESVLNFYPKKSIRLPKNPHIPLNMPKIAWSSYTFLRKHPDIKDLNITGEFNTTLPKFKMLELRRAYYSAVTFIDFQIGRVLMEVERLGLSSNTVVVFWSDHGFHLGENGEWCKNTAFEMSTWAPLMFHIPGVTDHGIESVQLAEFVDLYPTLLEAVGHRPPPICPQNSRKINFCVEGVSVLSLIDQPNKPIKTAVFSQVARPNKTMAYIVRTKNYRYTEYVHYNYATGKINWQTKAVELYDLSKDPFENINVAGFKKYGHVIAELRVKLKLGWRKSLLPNSSRNESRSMDKIISDQTTDVKSNDETRDVLSNDKTMDVLSNDKTMDVLSNDKTKDVHVLSNYKTMDALSNDKTMDVLSNDKTREVTRSDFDDVFICKYSFEKIALSFIIFSFMVIILRYVLTKRNRACRLSNKSHFHIIS